MQPVERGADEVRAWLEQAGIRAGPRGDHVPPDVVCAQISLDDRERVVASARSLAPLTSADEATDHRPALLSRSPHDKHRSHYGESTPYAERPSRRRRSSPSAWARRAAREPTIDRRLAWVVARAPRRPRLQRQAARFARALLRGAARRSTPWSAGTTHEPAAPMVGTTSRPVPPLQSRAQDAGDRGQTTTSPTPDALPRSETCHNGTTSGPQVEPGRGGCRLVVPRTISVFVPVMRSVRRMWSMARLR